MPLGNQQLGAAPAAGERCPPAPSEAPPDPAGFCRRSPKEPAHAGNSSGRCGRRTRGRAAAALCRGGKRRRYAVSAPGPLLSGGGSLARNRSGAAARLHCSFTPPAGRACGAPAKHGLLALGEASTAPADSRHAARKRHPRCYRTAHPGHPPASVLAESALSPAGAIAALALRISASSRPGRTTGRSGAEYSGLAEDTFGRSSFHFLREDFALLRLQRIPDGLQVHLRKGDRLGGEFHPSKRAPGAQDSLGTAERRSRRPFSASLSTCPTPRYQTSRRQKTAGA